MIPHTHTQFDNILGNFNSLGVRTNNLAKEEGYCLSVGLYYGGNPERARKETDITSCFCINNLFLFAPPPLLLNMSPKRSKIYLNTLYI